MSSATSDVWKLAGAEPIPPAKRELRRTSPGRHNRPKGEFDNGRISPTSVKKDRHSRQMPSLLEEKHSALWGGLISTFETSFDGGFRSSSLNLPHWRASQMRHFQTYAASLFSHPPWPKAGKSGTVSFEFCQDAGKEEIGQ
jgi:hypothetical protein